MGNEVCDDKRETCAHKTLFPPSYLHMFVQSVKVKGQRGHDLASITGSRRRNEAEAGVSERQCEYM